MNILLTADPSYLSQFSKGSLSPDKEKHSTYFVIDPASGIPLTVVARFQVNLFVEPIKGEQNTNWNGHLLVLFEYIFPSLSAELNMFKNLKNELFFPAFWFETTMVLDDGMKTQLWFLSNIQCKLLFSAGPWNLLGDIAFLAI